MKRPAYPVLLAAALLICCAPRSRAAGTAGASFLRVGWGARAAAMGEAYTAVADDVDAVYWNPAGLTGVKKLQQAFGHNAWIEGINNEHAAFAVRRDKRDVIGAGIGFLNVGDIERSNKYGYTEGYYGANDLVLVGSYARQLKPRLALGASLKLIRERIESESASAYAADFGAAYEASPRLQLGASLKNLGTSLGYETAPVPLPMSLRAGAALQFRKNIILSSDVHLPFDDSLGLHFGAEYLYPSPVKGVKLAFRGGFKTSAMSYLGAMAALSLGFGAEAGAVGFNYALSPYGDLGMAHRLDLKIKFDSLRGNGSLTVEKGGRKVVRDAGEVFSETLKWLDAKAASEKLGQKDQDVILKRIIEKFAPLGVDVSPAKARLGGGSEAR